jgi:hypothetical protein
MAPDCSKFQRGDYIAECWESTDRATRFSLSVPTWPVGDFSRSRFGRMWSRECLYLTQGIAGNSSSRNFAFVRPSGGGPSIQQLLGGLIDALPAGPGNSTTVPWFDPHFGQKVVTTVDDVIQQSLIFGAYWTPDPSKQGSIPLVVDDWEDRDNLRGVSGSGLDVIFPTFHGPPMDLASRNTGTDPTAGIKRVLTTTHLVHVTGIDPEGFDPIATSIRSRLP